MRTASPNLQAKLDELAAFCAAGDKSSFVNAFVPLDLTSEETAGYLSDLNDNEAEWMALAAEIAAIADGKTVTKIVGDETDRTTFFFPHPTLEGCDREVVFVCVGGEWRAEG